MAHIIRSPRPWFEAKLRYYADVLAGIVEVEAGTDGLSAGTLQETLQALATRIQTLEDAAG